MVCTCKRGQGVAIQAIGGFLNVSYNQERMFSIKVGNWTKCS